MASQLPDYYQLLDLSGKSRVEALSAADVRAAYRQALLKHHPDKVDSKQNSRVTVDDIALAYKTLSDPKLRAEYDRHLRSTGHSGGAGEAGGKSLRTGLETVDLDDLHFDSDANTWRRSCRCGDDTGFAVSEAELEGNVEDGEVIVGCKGCSLWLRVLFSVEA